MKNYLKVSMLICFLLSFSSTILAGEKIVAEVNGEPITISTKWSVENCLLPAERKKYNSLNREEKEKFTQKTKREWLWDMVDNELLYQEAKGRGIAVTEKEVNEKLNQMLPEDESENILKMQRRIDNNLNLTLKQLKERRRKYLPRSLMVGKLKQQVLSNVTVSDTATDEEARRYYEANKDEHWTSYKIISFQHHWFDSKEKAQDVKSALLLEESSFPSVVEALEFLKKGEHAGWGEERYGLDEELPFYAKNIKSMKENEFSEIIKGEDEKYHFIEYYGIRKVGKDQSFEEVKEEIKQSLLSDNQKLLADKLNAALGQFTLKLRSEADIEIYDEDLKTEIDEIKPRCLRRNMGMKDSSPSENFTADQQRDASDDATKEEMQSEPQQPRTTPKQLSTSRPIEEVKKTKQPTEQDNTKPQSTLHLKNGRIITGEIISKSNDSIKIKTGLIEFTIDRDDIDRIEK